MVWESDAAAGPARRDRVFLACLALVLLPFVVGLVATIGTHWTPVGDWGLLELRTRGVGGPHTPLVGPYSRFGWSHPGPALFFVLAVPYRVLGSRPAGLLVAALLVNGASAGGMLLLAWRRGGRAITITTAIAVALLCRALGAEFLRDPWNPYIAVLPLALLVFLAWSIACGDGWVVPFAALVASFVVQTHVGYAVLVVTVLVVATVWRVVVIARERPARPRRRTAAIALVTIAVAALAWLPPLLDQIANPGNLDAIWRFFRKRHRTPSLDTAFRLVGKAVALPGAWITGHDSVNTNAFVPVASGLVIPAGLVVLLIGAVVALRRRDRDRLALVVLTIAGLAAGVYSVAHVVGPLAAYLVRWLFALGMLCWLASVWALWPALTGVARFVRGRAVAVLAMVVLVGVTAAAVHDAVRAHAPWSRVGAVEERLARDTVAHFRGDGRPVLLESNGDDWFTWGLAPRLEAAGIDVAARPRDVLHFGRHRVSLLHDARLAIVVVVGPDARSNGPAGGRLLASVVGRPLTGPPPRHRETYLDVVDLAERRLLTDTVAVYEVPRP